MFLGVSAFMTSCMSSFEKPYDKTEHGVKVKMNDSLTIAVDVIDEDIFHVVKNTGKKSTLPDYVVTLTPQDVSGVLMLKTVNLRSPLRAFQLLLMPAVILNISVRMVSVYWLKQKKKHISATMNLAHVLSLRASWPAMRHCTDWDSSRVE